jgi:hypothetical protein
MKPIPDPSPEKAGLPDLFDPNLKPEGVGLGQALKTVGAYRPGLALKSVGRDEAIQRYLFFGLVFSFLLSTVQFPPGMWFWSLLSWAALIVWIVTGFSQARLWQEMAQASQLIDGHPVLAEHMLAGVGTRSMVQAPIRANFYYRLSLLRFRQRRYVEAAMIADDLIALDHRTLRQHRANLLLMRTECALRLGDLNGAYRGLSELHPMNLSLLESLQRLLLRTLYESNTRRYDHVMHGWRDKVISADLMPQAQCRMMHDLMAAAAKQRGMPDLGQWLSDRAGLLGEPVNLRPAI